MLNFKFHLLCVSFLFKNFPRKLAKKLAKKVAKKTVCKTEILERKKFKSEVEMGAAIKEGPGKASWLVVTSWILVSSTRCSSKSIFNQYQPPHPPPTSFFSSDECVRPRLQGWHRHSSRGGYREETGGCCVSSGAG